ncbi:HYR domain-containing protein [Aureitalea sp. L0-47]|uniref:HYR domain-containing protein n=1 Tax=Aureitalea sp. L0-47 TaxID=2816962 RepID=UPI002238F7D0|nr:HYR domain-containing protein [Aureitalea sp. L0-47]MCW5518357.1 HYR domain-containing protein [Aureitalea sp. L0-47]
MKTSLAVIFCFLSLSLFAQDDPPVAVCMDVPMLTLDASGMAMITGADVDGGSTDDMGAVTLSVTPNTFDCTNLGANTVTLTVTDSAGQTDTCTAMVTVVDTIPPVALCQDITIQVDAMGNASITAFDVDNGSTDNCAITTLSASPNTFSCADIGPNNVTLTVTDSSGNTASCTAVVTVQDSNSIPPVAVCQDITIQLDAMGVATITADMLDGGSTDNCDNLSFSASRTSFDCLDVFNPPLASMIVTGVIDGPLPAGTPKSVELYVTEDIADLTQFGLGIANDGGGTDGQEFTFSPGTAVAGSFIYVASESTDFNSFFGFSPNETSAVIDVDGNDSVELYFNGSVIDVFGEINQSGSMTPWDYEDGWAYRKNNTGPNGNGFQQNDWFFSGPNVLDGETSNAMALIPMPVGSYAFTPSGVANPISVTLTVTDGNGDSDTCTANVTVEDNIAPTAVCQNITVQLNDAGEVFLDQPSDPMNPTSPTYIQLIAGASTDNCSVATFTAEPSAFFCDDIGTNSIVITVTDIYGNQSICSSATVTVEDNVVPTMMCQDITVQLDVSGNATITVDDIDNGSQDACGLASRSLDISTFSCADIGPNTVVLTVTDTNGNSNSCSATVTVVDNIPPEAVCQNITVQLDANGMASITANSVDGGSGAACGIDTLAVDITDFDCSDLGDNPVTLTVTDNNGNFSDCIAIVTVSDAIAPVAAAMDITVQLDVTGNAFISGNMIDNGSTDNCSIASLEASPDMFTCADVTSPVPVTLTVTDTAGNTSTAMAMVTVEDVEAPVAACQDITLQLDASGNASIIPGEVDGGSSVSCGAASFSIDRSSFTCADIGTNNVVLTVTNSSGLSSSCTAVVTVEDFLPPVAVCQDITVQLDSGGNASITVNDIDNGSSDNCGIASRTLDVSNFTCADIGVNSVTLTVTDNNGNSSSCTANVTVEDTIAPQAVCQNITIPLDVSGQAIISAMDVDGGSTDFCGITSRAIDVTAFDCSNIGANTVVLTVTDASGNTDSCVATVTVEDVTPPTVVCQNITVQLDASGTVTINPIDLDNGSSDACGIATYSLNNSFFNCNSVGANSVILTVTDTSGNSSSCNAIVTVEDSVAPSVSCQDITLQLDASGVAFIDPSAINSGSSDACGISTVEISQSTFDCGDLGANNITLTMTDVNGNSNSCIAVVTVVDTVDPVVDCPSNQVESIPNGTMYSVPDYFADGLVTASDNCTDPLTNYSQNPTPGTLLDVGTYTVSVTITDDNGNSESCNFQLEVDFNLGSPENQSITEIELFPNPTTEHITADNLVSAGVNKIRLYDLNGRLIKQIQLDGNTKSVMIDTSELASGLYLLFIDTESGVVRRKFIKE